MDHLATNPDNIRYNGTGRMYFRPYGEIGFIDFGELDTCALSSEVSTDELKSTRTAAKATIRKEETERSASVNFALREWSDSNLSIAFLGSDFSSSNQAAGYQALAELATVNDRFVELGKRDVSITRLSHGAVSNGPFQVGEEVTGGTSGASGIVAWRDDSAGYMELVNVSATFQAGETVSGGTSSASAELSGVGTMKDVVVVNSATPTTRYVQGTDYDLDLDAGMFRVLSSGSIASNPYVAFNCPALAVSVADMLSGASAEGSLKFVTDGSDGGPRGEILVHKAKLVQSGETTLLGEGIGLLPINAEILFDPTQPSGKEYYSFTRIG